jgi:hypothetical protein
MSDTAFDVEIRLAAALAESYARDWETLLEYMPELEGADDDDREAVLALYEDGLIERALDEIADRDEQARQPRRRRSPIEMMVDQACGIEVLDNGTIVELQARPRR